MLKRHTRLIMKNQIEIKKINRFLGISTPAFCFDDCLATIAYYLNIDYSFVYFNALEFQYENNKLENDIGEKIKVDFDLCSNMYDYFGIAINFKYGKLSQYIDEIKMSLEKGMPVLIEIYGNKWKEDWRYNTDIEGSHTFLISGLLDEKFSIVDPYYEYYKSNVDIEVLERAFRSIGLIVINKNEQKIPTRKYIEDRLFNNIIKIKSMFEMERDINSESTFKNSLISFDMDCTGKVDWAIPQNCLINKIREIVYNHIRFANFISKYYNKQELLDKILMISQKWNNILLYIVKMISSKNVDYNKRNRLLDKVKVCIENDINILNEILVNDKEDRIIVENGSGGRCKFINLELYYNNQAVGKKRDGIGEFSEQGDYIKEESFNMGRKVLWNNIAFWISKNKELKDNIVASSNDIIINECAKKVAILGCAYDDIVREQIDIIYEDDSIESKYVIFYDCVPNWNERKSNDIVEQFMKSVMKNGKEIDEELAFLYGIEIFVNSNKIKRIHIPNNERIHIFAISIVE